MAKFINPTDGTPQSTFVNNAFAAQLEASVVDDHGVPQVGITVTFTAPSSGASCTPVSSTAVTDSLGMARKSVIANAITGSYTVSATASGVTGSAAFALTNNALPPAPVITSTLSANATVGTAFTYQITASNSPTSFSAAPLPPGLSVNPSTGVISGTPTTAGSTNITVGATNNGGTGTAVLVVSIVNPPPPLDTILPVSGTPQNTHITTAFPVSLSVALVTSTEAPDVGASVTFVTPSSGPSGLFSNGLTTMTVLTNALGVASVTFTAGVIVGAFTVTASSPVASGGVSFALTNTALPPPPTITSGLTVSGTQNVPFTYQITATDSPLVWSAVPLPSGLVINAGTGLITGIPTVAGATSVTLGATNSGGTGTAVLVLTVNNAPPPADTIAIATGTPQSADLGTIFTVPISVQVLIASTGLPDTNTFVSFTAPSSGPGAVFFGNGNTTIAIPTNVNGVATTGLIANKTAGSYTITATTPNAPGNVQFALTNTTPVPGPSAPNNIVPIDGTPQSTTIRTSFPVPFKAQVLSRGTNAPIVGVTVTFSAFSSTAGGSFPGVGFPTSVNVVTDAQGIATAPLFTANEQVGTYTVQASTPSAGGLLANVALFNCANTDIGLGLRTLQATASVVALKQAVGVVSTLSNSATYTLSIDVKASVADFTVQVGNNSILIHSTPLLDVLVGMG